MKNEIIRFNTDEQLFEKGLDANGVSLESIGGTYSEITVLLKSEAGLPVDRVTLFDTGDFYDSFTVTAGKDDFVISADTIKEGEDFNGNPTREDLQERWGADIIGLSDESISELSEQLIKDIATAIKAKILQ